MSYEEWRNYHLMVFGMNTDQDALMVQSWANLFESEGFSAEELTEATKFMATHEPPKFRQEHLQQIQDRIRFSRERSRGRQDRPEHPLGICTLCNSYGVLGVPAAGMITKDGNTIEMDSVKTMSVYCRCALGRHMHGNRQYSGLTTLDEYEKSHADWPQEMKRISQLLKSRFEVSRKTTSLDKVLGQIINKARGRDASHAAPQT